MFQGKKSSDQLQTVQSSFGLREKDISQKKRSVREDGGAGGGSTATAILQSSLLCCL